MRSQEIDVNTLLSSEVLRGWGVNDKTGMDPLKNFFFFHLTSPHFKSELLYILDYFSCFFCFTLVLLFYPCLICKMMSIAATLGILPARLQAHPCKLLCIYCIKQLAKYLYCICQICSGPIFCLHCKRRYKKYRPVDIGVLISKSWLI